MIIEIREKGTKAFYDEIVCVASKYRRYVKNPDAGFSNTFMINIIMMVLVACIFLLELYIGITNGFDWITITAGVVCVVTLYFWGLYHRKLKKVVKLYEADNRLSTLILDENGVELNKEGAQVLRISWENVAVLKVFKESTFFFSKDEPAIVIAINNVYKDQVLGYVKENNIPITIAE